MRFPIGAMSVGDILDRGLKILLSRLPALYAIQLIIQGPLIIIQVLFPLLISEDLGARQRPEVAIMAGLVMMGVALLTLIFQPLGTAATVYLVGQEFLDQRADVWASFGFAFRRFGTVLLTAILYGLTIIAGTLMCFVPAIIFAVWFAFVMQIVVVEGLGAGAAFTRSQTLTEGFRWRIFGILFLIVLIMYVAALAGAGLQFVLPSYELVPVEAVERPGLPRAFQEQATEYREVLNFRNHAITTLVGQLLTLLVQSFMAVCVTLLYFDIRIRKEGYDLEMLARQEPEPPMVEPV